MTAVILLGTLTMFFLLVGGLAAGIDGIVTGVILSFFIAAFLLAYSPRLILRISKAEPYQNFPLQRMIAYICQEAKLPVPRLFHIPSPQPNSFVVGVSKRNASLVVTDGVLRLNEGEQWGMLAHEIAHIKKGHMLSDTLAAALGVALSFPSERGFAFLEKKEAKNKKLLSILFFVLSLPGAFFVWLGISSSWKSSADWTGALLIKNPEAVSCALRAVSSPSIQVWSATSHLWLVSPFRGLLSQLFQNFPPLERRIELLEVTRSF